MLLASGSASRAQTAPVRILVGAPADGGTLLMSFTSHAINASLYRSLPFDPERDFTPLTMVSTSPAIQDVLAGQVEMMFANVGNAHAHLKAGKLKALGVTSPKRLPGFPEVPAIAEALPGYQSNAWFGLFGPGRMDAELAKRISDAARQAIAAPDVQRRIASEGATPVGNSPDEFARFVHAEIQRWAKVVKYSGAKPE